MAETVLNAKDRKALGIVAAKIKVWREDPRVFVREVCHDVPDAWQDDVLLALTLHPKIAMKACKGPGKSRMLAWMVWWWLFTRWHSNIIATSITADNLRDNLWAELARVLEQSPILQRKFEHKGERIECREHPKTWWCAARSFPQNADKTQQANTIAGMHGRFPMIVCDEVGDYPDGVVVAAEGIFANDVEAKLVLAGNPTRTDGPLYRVCTRDRSRWWVKEITGDPDEPNRASRISLTWARQMIEDWGRDNPWVLVNVFGKFPPVQDNKLLGPEECAAACSRAVPKHEYMQDPLVMGLDVARYGDNQSVLYRRQGKMGFTPRTWRETDLMTLADQVAREIAEHKPAAVFIDGTGVGGGVVDRLRQLGFEVIPVDFGGKPTDEKFYDRRSEMWWRMAEWVKQGGGVPDEGSIKEELCAPNYSFTNTGRQTRFKLETKAEMKKRGVVSPDRADALALTFAATVAIPQSVMQRSEAPYFAAGPSMRIRGGTEEDWDPFN